MLSFHDAIERTRFAVRPSESSQEGVRIHRLKGIFTNCPRAYEFLEELRAELKESAADVILDLGGVVHLSSGGVGMLAALYTSARDAERSLKVAASRPRVTAVMRATGLLPLIPAYESIEDALQDRDGGARIDAAVRRTGTD